ncbi:hypothetical protein M0812_20191 [Anaeramoeba flamelloides]|uniref:RNA helicase n=1 Tax=Anaeramoeba flamelloides TaxID=1746091 RepID=A0AAV7YW89_9EUKA|nr:hypothetical protein M0812_20191 [Anaeramoeba flamelloides]
MLKQFAENNRELLFPRSPISGRLVSQEEDNNGINNAHEFALVTQSNENGGGNSNGNGNGNKSNQRNFQSNNFQIEERKTFLDKNRSNPTDPQGKVMAINPKSTLEMEEEINEQILQSLSKDLQRDIRTAIELGQDPRENIQRLYALKKHFGIGNEKLGINGLGIGKSTQTRYRQISSPERWENKQLKQAGFFNVNESVNYDDELGGLDLEYEEVAEDIEIERTNEEPLFLQGQTQNSITLSPIKIVKNPDGSLQRAAVTQSAISKERREILTQERNDLIDSIPKNLNRPWADPLSKKEDRKFAQDFRGIGIVGINKSASNQKLIPEWKKSTFGKAISYGKKTTLSIKEQREFLPIFRFKDELMKAVEENQVLIVIGETGSGKTTQITQYLAGAGYTARGKIGCTQPRRVAAISVAKRVSEEFGCRVGQEVGYCIRFEDCTSKDTIIKFMTDGMLMREALLDPDLKGYSMIMLDEAHERSLQTDVLFGLLKKILFRRPSLKLIVTSATLEADKFSEYFYGCPIFRIPGRTYKVEILYPKEPENDYLDASLITILQIHLTRPPGDILLFLTGQEEIDTACQILFERMKQLDENVPELIILPVYSAQPSEMQTRIFEPTPKGKRKCVIATNIAETSLTIDGIYYVIDPGFVKQKCYNPRLGMDSLVVVPISQAAADQRAGRADRTGPGMCFRLYTEQAYKSEMFNSSVPEIQRTNMGNTLLTLKAMGINDLISFDFMDPPSPQSLIAAMKNLFMLGDSTKMGS